MLDSPFLAEASNFSLETVVVSIWCLSLGVLSFLLIPRVQGTVPAYVIALASVPFCLLIFKSDGDGLLGRYVRDWCTMLLVWLFFLVVSQLTHIVTEIGYANGLNYISGESRMLFRRSMFTQFLYLIACFGTFAFFRHWPRENIERLVFLGAWFVAIYGLYEWVYYLLTGRSGDFVLNRTFNGSHSASWSQSMSVAGFNLLRVKSTLGEPSFFSAVAVPFLFMAYLTNRKVLSIILGFGVVFTWSTSAYAGVLVGLSLLMVFGYGYRFKASLALLGSVALVLAIYLFLPDIFSGMLTDKLSGLNGSGAIRLDLEEMSSAAVESLSLFHKIFGLGYGYVYSSVWQAALFNLGWLGGLILIIYFTWPFVANVLIGKFSKWGFACVVILALYVINVAELYLPTTWALLGLAWRDFDRLRLPPRMRSDGI